MATVTTITIIATIIMISSITHHITFVIIINDDIVIDGIMIINIIHITI